LKQALTFRPPVRRVLMAIFASAIAILALLTVASGANTTNLFLPPQGPADPLTYLRGPFRIFIAAFQNPKRVLTYLLLD
jgi:hypothetical protein